MYEPARREFLLTGFAVAAVPTFGLGTAWSACGDRTPGAGVERTTLSSNSRLRSGKWRNLVALPHARHRSSTERIL